MAYGFVLPFRQSTGSSDYFEVTSTLVHSVEQNLRTLLITNWGERPMQFYFGCNLKEFLFEQRNSTLASVIADRVIQQVAKWMPFLRIDSLNILFEGDLPSIPENGLAVNLVASIVSDPTKTVTLFQAVTP